MNIEETDISICRCLYKIDMSTIKSTSIFNLYSCLSRGNDIRVMECVDCLFSEATGQAKKDLLKTISYLIGYVRDPVYGMGERDLTYVLICTLYKYDPVQAMYAVRMITENIDDSGPIGSWADIKYFCEYVRTSPFVFPKDKDVMIDTAIGLLVHQLKKDRGAWNSAMGKYLQIKRADPNTLVERPVGREVMSLAAKWTPREKSKFGWIFSHVISTFGGNISERDFRRMLSALNRELDTVQIKQCAGRWAEIEPDSVSITTLSRQRRAFLRVGSEDRVQCAENFKEIGSRSRLGLGKTQIPDLVKRAFDKDRDSDLLNSQWANIVGERIGTMSIPIIDISWDLETDKRYKFIGDGILIAQRYMERLMLADHMPVWIEALHSDKFTDIIDRIRPYVDRATDSCFIRAFTMIRESFHMSKTSPDSVIFHVFSDQHIDVEYNVIYNSNVDFIHLPRYKLMCIA